MADVVVNGMSTSTYDATTEGGTSIDAKTVSSFDFVVDDVTVAVESIDTASVPILDDDIFDVPVHVLTSLDEITRKLCSYGSMSSDRAVATLNYSNNSRGIKFNELEEYQPLTIAGLISQYSAGNSSCNRSGVGVGAGTGAGALSRSGTASALTMHYHPGYNPWVSPHHKVPLDSQVLLSDRPVTDTHLLLKVNSCGPKYYFEPLFLSAALFRTGPDGSIAKISESYSFDCTPDDVRGEYDAVYAANVAAAMMGSGTGCGSGADSVPRPGSGSSSVSTKAIPRTSIGSIGSSGSSMGSDSPALHHTFSSESACVAASDFDPITKLRSCLFTLPNDLRDQNIFLVFQVNKVLSSDGDKAVAPYLKGPSSALSNGSMSAAAQSEVAKHRDLCQRLGMFRQSVGVGAVKVFDRQWRVGGGSGGETNVLMHAQRVQMNETQLGQYLRDLFPEDGAGASKCRLDTLGDFELRLSLHDLGRESQFADRVPPEAVAPDAKDPHLFGQVVPAQFYNAHEAARVSKFFRRFSTLERHCIKQVLPLIPPSSVESDDVTRRVRRAVDNSLFVYPLALEKFNHRNLCLCVQLIEFEDPLVGASPLMPPDISCTHRVLRNVYSTMAGDVFVAGAYTRVTYHSKTPSLNEEFKIRLPNVLTPRHWLLFTVLHVHVRPKKERSSFMGAMRRVSMGNSSGVGGLGDKDGGDPSCISIGHGFLQLLQKHPYPGDHVGRHDALLPDDTEHVVVITPVDELGAMDAATAAGVEDDTAVDRRASLTGVRDSARDKSTMPLLRLSTRALSSMYSKCPRVQSLLKLQTAPVGRLPTTAPGVQQLWDKFIEGHPQQQQQLPDPTTQPPATQVATTGEIAVHPAEAAAAPVRVSEDISATTTAISVQQQTATTTATTTATGSATAHMSVSTSLTLDLNLSTNSSSLSPLTVPRGSTSSVSGSMSYMSLIKESNVKTALMQLLNANNNEVATFFYPLMRQLLRTMASGSGDELQYGDPAACPPARCWAFLAMVHTFGKIAPAIIFSGRQGQGQGQGGGGGMSDTYGDFAVPSEEDLISSYVEYLFDEEGEGEGEAGHAAEHAAGHAAGGAGGGDDGDGEPEEESQQADGEHGPSNNYHYQHHRPSSPPPLGDCFSSLEEYAEVCAAHLVGECARILTEQLVDDAVSRSARDLFLNLSTGAGAGGVSSSKHKHGSSSKHHGHGSSKHHGHSPSSLSAVEINPSGGVTGGAKRGVVGGIRNLFGIPTQSGSGGDGGNSIGSGSVAVGGIALQPGSGSVSAPLMAAESISRELGIDVREVLGLMNDWSSSGASNLDLLVHRGMRSGAGAANAAGGLFDSEREYFQYLDSGLSIVMPGRPHPDDVIVGDNNKANTADADADADATGGSGTASAEFDCDEISDFPERSSASPREITVRAALPPYCRVQGYAERTAAAAANNSRVSGSIQNKNMKERGRHLQWWPWLYEVLVHQWLQVLTCLHGPAQLSLSLSVSPRHSAARASLSAAYPLSLADLPKSNKDHQDTRILLMDHSPSLFAMIIKSLALRVHRERKRVPVVLDNAFVETLEQLVCALAVEISSRFASQWHYERLNAAFSKFLCELAALVVPSVMSRLVTAYCVQIRQLVVRYEQSQQIHGYGHGQVQQTVGSKKTEAASGAVGVVAEALELQLRVFDHLSLLDFFVPLNFPVPVDFPLRAVLRSDFQLSVGQQELFFASSRYLRGDTDPLPCWLVHTLIREALSVYRRADVGIIQRQFAVGILRDLLVRHAYDVRYQRPEDAEQIALMYFPLFGELLRECEHLFGLQHDSWERKELLFLLLHLLRNIPGLVMREQLRLFAQATSASITEETRRISQGLLRSRSSSSSSVNGGCSTGAGVGTGTGTGAGVGVGTGGFTEPGTGVSSSSSSGGSASNVPYLSYVRVTKTNSSIVDQATARVTARSDLFRCVYLFHLALDTFEFPMSKGGESGIPTCVLAPGLDAALDGSTGNMMDTMSDQKSKLENILMQKTGGGGAKRVFRPVAGATEAGFVDGGSGGSGGNGTLGGTKPAVEMRKWRKNIRSGSTRGGGRLPPAGGGGDAVMSAPVEKKYHTLGGTERYHLLSGVGGVDSTVRNRRLLSVPKVAPMELLNAAKGVSSECSSILLDSLKQLLEEGAPVLAALQEQEQEKERQQQLQQRRQHQQDNGSGPSQGLVASAVAGAVVTEFLAQVIVVVLHGLHLQQCEVMVVRHLNMLRLILRRHSGRDVFRAMADTLQDWLRTLLLCCSSQSTKIRIPACNVLLLLLRSYFYFFGTIDPLARMTRCVFGDVLTFVLEQHVKSVGVAEFLNPLEVSIGQMIAGCKNYCARAAGRAGTDISARFAVVCADFVGSLSQLFRAHDCLRRQKQIVVVDYDSCSNMLDGPFDAKAMARLAAVKATNSSANSSSSATTTAVDDPYAVMELFYQAADLFSPLHNPRQHIYWLENLTKYQEIQGNLAESAELRWKIYQTCCHVAASYHELSSSKYDGRELWSPRGILAWEKGGRAVNIMLQRGSAGDSGSARVSVSLRNFLLGMYSELHVKEPSRCWHDRDQLYAHMEVALKVAAERYSAASLFSLAERAWLHMVALYRFDRNVKKIAWAYDRISQTYRNMTEANTAFAMGSFFRVLYVGRAVPPSLRDREFIYRNGKQLHVSEFQDLIKKHLLGLVPPGTAVSVVPDTQNLPESATGSDSAGTAVIVMTSVKPLMTNASPFVSLASCLDDRSAAGVGTGTGTGTGVGGPHSVMFSGQLIENALVDNSVTDEIVCDAASATQVYKFQYSVPFTRELVPEGGKRRAHAKHMEDQWKRTIVLRVKESFPAVVTRQQVVGREIRELSPIENGTEDIMERIESMQALLCKSEDSGCASIDKNNIMRLVQGTVMPQVNAGVTEVAKVFLHRLPDPSAHALLPTKDGEPAVVTARQQMKLQLTLIEFMVNAKKCLELTRKLLLSPSGGADGTENEGVGGAGTSGGGAGTAAAGGTPGGGVGAPGAPSENSYQIWQSEMEKAYDGLVAVLAPVLTVLLPDDDCDDDPNPSGGGGGGSSNITNGLASASAIASQPLYAAANVEAQELCTYCRRFVQNINLKRI